MKELDKLNVQRLTIQGMQRDLCFLQTFDSTGDERTHILQLNSHLEWLLAFYTDQTLNLKKDSHEGTRQT